MGVCVRVNVLCGNCEGIVRKKPLCFFPSKEKDIFIEIKREKGEGNLSRV